MTYTKAEFLYPQISEYLSELVTSKTEEMRALADMFMLECNFEIQYQQIDNTFQYTFAFNSEIDFDNAIKIVFSPIGLQPDYNKVELSLNVDQSSPNIILSYTIV